MAVTLGMSSRCRFMRYRASANRTMHSQGVAGKLGRAFNCASQATRLDVLAVGCPHSGVMANISMARAICASARPTQSPMKKSYLHSLVEIAAKT